MFNNSGFPPSQLVFPVTLSNKSRKHTEGRGEPYFLIFCLAAGGCSMISDNGHHASARTVCVAQVVPTADSRSERLRVLLKASSNRNRLTRAYLIQLSLTSQGFSKK